MGEHLEVGADELFRGRLKAAGEFGRVPDKLRRGPKTPRLGLLSSYQDWLLNLFIENTYKGFIMCIYARGTSARREFSVRAQTCKGDASWFRRWLIRVSHMPLAQHVPTDALEGDILSNPQGDGNYYVMWNAKTGYMWVKPQ